MAKKNAINNKSDPLDATTLTVNSAYTFPNADGTNNQVLQTDGGGNVTWQTVGGSGDIIWNEIDSSITAEVKNGYICNATSEITITMPTTYAQGDVIKIVGKGPGGWRVKPNTGDTMYYLDRSVDNSSYFHPTNSRGCCEVHGITANSEWEITEVEDTDFLDGAPVIVCGASRQSFAQTDGFQLRGWGNNSNGTLGTGREDTTDKSSPVNILGPPGGNEFIDIKGVGFQKLALESNGSAYIWGNFSYSTGGSAGQDTGHSTASPSRIFGSVSFISIGTGYSGYGSPNCGMGAVASDGTAYTWGYNDSGQLGTGDRNPRSTPSVVIGGHLFTKIMTSLSHDSVSQVGRKIHTLGLKANGEVWAWGGNNDRQLADGTNADKSSPVQVLGGHSFIDIAAGVGSSYGLKADGSLWAWGYNGSGQLGTNDIATKSVPTSVVGGHSFIKVVAGGTSLGTTGRYYYMAALKADGSVWTCGRNSGGVLGDNTNTNKSSPVSVVGGHSFIDIAAGVGGITNRANHIVAVKADGSVWCWGYNGNGQLGDNTTADKSSPVQVVGT